MSVKLAVAVAVLLTGGAIARGQDQNASSFKLFFHGYGTLGFVYSSEEQADFFGNTLNKRGAGHTLSFSPEVDSRIGAQVSATLTSTISAVIQMISEQRVDGSYSPRIEWANVKFQITPEASVRVGRIVLPVFMVSDFRKIGHSNVWVRPPTELYGLIPISFSDGVDASYRVVLGQFINTLQANYGRNEARLAEGGKIESRNSWGLTLSTERGSAKARLGYQQMAPRIDGVRPLFDAFRQFGPEGVSIAERYDVDGSALRFFSVGAQYDPGIWFVMGEAARRRTRSSIASQTAWYLSGGRRFGKITPYLTYSTIDTDSNVSDPGLTLSVLPPELREVAAELNAILNGILGRSPIQDSISIGTRWDLRTNVALKGQFSHNRLGEDSSGSLANLQPGFTPNGNYNLVSVSVDFVF